MALEKWSLTDHICSNCFGRILERQKGGKFAKCSENTAQLELFSESADPGAMAKHRIPEIVKVFRCADCGRRAVSNDHRDICCCGMKLKDGTDLGVRCVASHDSDTVCQTEIVAKQVVNDKEKEKWHG
ncbi:MAG: hypothetical protein IPI17_03335 [Nitrosomonas sp.]|jgi:hypothetical protein|nr:hypothetical protein [Nitrosomonas sp.]